MTTYTLERLKNSTCPDIKDMAERLINDGFPLTARFEIVLRQVVV